MKKTAAEGAKPGFRSRIVTILAGAGAVAYALFVFVPGQQSTAALRRETGEKQRQIDKTILLQQPIRDLELKLATTEQFTSTWRRQAPQSSRVAPLFAEMIRHAQETGAEVTHFTPQSEQSLDLIGLIPISLQAEGSYHSMHRFLERLEGLHGTVWVDDLKLQPEGDSSQLKATMKLIIFSDRSEISG